MLFNDEKQWLRRFYEGTFAVKGWNDYSREILGAVPTADKEKIGALLANLGETIGREWSKDNCVRKIDTPMLKQWGGRLQASKDKGASVLIGEIEAIQGEADRILGV